MEPREREHKRNPLQLGQWTYRIFMCWLTPLLCAGRKRQLEEKDMYDILPDDLAESLGKQLQRYWDREVQKAAQELQKPSLTKVLFQCYGKCYAMHGIWAFLGEGIRVLQPVLLGRLILFFESYESGDKGGLYEAYGYATALALSALVQTVLQHLFYFHILRVGMRVRVAICHMIYRKALSLSNMSMGRTTTGQIVNLLSNDVKHFDEVTLNLHYLWLAPLQAIVVIALLWHEIGLSCLAGVTVIMLMMPSQTLLGRLFAAFGSKTASLTDSRIRTMNEVVSGIRIIKMYAWEKPFASLVSELRRKEIAEIMKSSHLRALNLASFFAGCKIIIFVTFAAYTLLGNNITASRVFYTVSLYGIIKLTLTLFFPIAIQKASETMVSIGRFQNFLLLDEIDRQRSPPCQKEDKGHSVIIENMTCYWDKWLDAPSLQNISLSLKSQQLMAVIGPVGSGKSSLLSAILGELPPDKGVLEVNGMLTYACQQPWVFPGTIRSNILFGKDMDPSKYDRVLRACALKRDMELLQDGDLTMIGDRGATLSGGQKARVNLARAVYQDADIYLLDDPLSAVDAEVGRHLFEECICGILKHKPRILVTHQLQYLKAVDQILVLKEGGVHTQGTYSQLQDSGLDFSLLRTPDNDADDAADGDDGGGDDGDDGGGDDGDDGGGDDGDDGGGGTKNKEVDKLSVHTQKTASSHGSMLSNGALLSLGNGVNNLHCPSDPPDPTSEGPQAAVAVTMEEMRAKGNVSARMYLKYFTAGCNPLSLVLVLLLSVAAEAVYILQDWWLVHWSTQLSENSTTLLPVGERVVNGAHLNHDSDLHYYLTVYAGLTVGTVVLGITRTVVIFSGLVRSSERLHNAMFTSILRSPVRFFDTNPIGRILNRFSKDIGQLDLLMPITFVDFYQLMLQNLGVVAVAIWVTPLIVIPLLPLLVLFLFLRRLYLSTSRDIKRLESTTRSPVFSHLSSSLQGLWTIRAFRAEERFQTIFDAHQDLHSAAWFMVVVTSRWFSLCLDTICSVFISFTTLGCVLCREGLGAGEVGLVLTYAITLMGSFQWTIRQSAEVENLMTSVERVIEYTELDSEAPWETQKRPPPDWPSQGLVSFDNINFSYSEDGPLVLRNMTATFLPREKVGVVGRTGAGKSSLISALFRLAEPKGKIYMDGVLTSELGLHDLRKKMSIIPQDPVLFTGTMRKNLDPFNQHSDEDLWSSLQEVQLKSVVEDLPGKLETVLAESGSNFSVGQRQLVCLARAILRKNRVLIIDEATANVDPRTDELIQNTIRDKFRDCTVLTIAHRLNTIIDSDRILVMDNGVIQAFGHAHILLQDKDSIFFNLVHNMGQTDAAAIVESARKVYQAAQLHLRPGEREPHTPNDSPTK